MKTNDILQYADEQIADVKYFYDETLTICVMTMVNGFKVVGESNVIDSTKYDKLKGMQISRQKAYNKFIDILAYSLKE